MYKIIGADHNEYGPSSADEIRQWIKEGRADGRTLVKAEGSSEWKPLASFPEFADLVAARPPAAITPNAAGDYSPLPQDILQRDYDLDIFSCVSRAWGAVMSNLGTMVGATAIYMLVYVAFTAAGRIRELILPITLARVCVEGPLIGGMLYFFLRNFRRVSVEVGDIFAGFRECFGTLVLVYVVQGLIILLAALPGLILLVTGIMPLIHKEAPTGNQITAMVAGLVLVLVPSLYLSISWIFSPILAIDKRLSFWQAMETSRKVVGKHWLQILGLSIVCGLISALSVLLCCVPVLVGIPVAMSAIAIAYEDIFSQRPHVGP